MRSDFDCSENCYLVGGNEPLVLLVEDGGGESTDGGISKFLASGG